MSMPSDTSPEITEAVEHDTTPTYDLQSHDLQSLHLQVTITRNQRGIAVAAAVAFVGVALLGPALARALQRQRRLEERIARRARDMRYRARAVGRQAQKRFRRLGDATFRR